MNSVNQENFMKSLRLEVNKYFLENKINRKGNYKIYIKSVFMISLYLVPYFIMILGFVDNPSFFWIFWLLMGLGMAGVGMSIMHDGNHGSFSNKKYVNRIMGFSLQLLGGTNKIWKIQHNRLHHTYTNMMGHDPDVSPIPLLRFSPSAPYKKFHRFQFIYAWFLYGLMTFSFATIKEFKQLIEWRNNSIISKKEFSDLMFDLIFFKFMYYIFILFIPLIVLNINFLQWFGLFFLMHFVAGFLLAIVFQTAHIMPNCKHINLPEKMNVNTWAINQVLTTCNYAPKSQFLSWFIGGLNYQIEHHLFPGVCHIHYANISKIVKRKVEEYGLPYNCKKNFLIAIFSHAKMLYALGFVKK